MTGEVLKLLPFLERLLNRWEVRLFLASLIVFSILPIDSIRKLDLLFFIIFGVEFVVRISLAQRAEKISRGEKAVLVADAVALISFLPIGTLVGARVLRFIRLARLVVLGRFLRTLAVDLRQILSQRQIRNQLGFLVAAVALITLLGGTILVTFEVKVDDFNGDGTPESGELGQVLWWVFRQIEDPGNLVENAHGDYLLLFISLALTIAGVFVMSFIIGMGTSVVGALMSASRKRPVPLNEHTVVLAGGREVRDVLEDLIEMYSKNRRKVRVAVLGNAVDPPPFLEEPEFRGIDYRSGEASRVEAQDLLTTQTARRVIVLNDKELGESSDAYAISSVLAVRQRNENCPIIVEMRHRRYMDMARVAGGGSINPVPMGKFLGSVMCQSMMFPGIDDVFEELLTARGSEIYTHIFWPPMLDRFADMGERFFSFRDLLLCFQQQHRAIPFGVLLGAGPWSYDVGEMVVWLNPLDEPPEDARALGARRGQIPMGALRGLIALAPEYATLRQAARATVCAGEIAIDHRECRPDVPALAVDLCHEMLEMHRVLILGVNEILPAIMENTAAFIPGVEIVVVVPEGQRHGLVDELRRRLEPVESVDEGDTMFALSKGGRARLVGSRGDLLADALEHPSLHTGALDVAVLLADAEETDPDANTALMLLRMIQNLGEKPLELSASFRIIAEVLSRPKGALLQDRLGIGGPWPVRIIPTQQMRAFFLVHSAYVPGSDLVHLELVGPRAQDFCQVRVEGDERELDFTEIVDRLSCGSPPAICFGIKLGQDHPRPGLMLNPSASESRIKFKLPQLEAVYAVGETAKIASSFQTKKSWSRERS